MRTHIYSTMDGRHIVMRKVGKVFYPYFNTRMRVDKNNAERVVLELSKSNRVFLPDSYKGKKIRIIVEVADDSVPLRVQTKTKILPATPRTMNNMKKSPRRWKVKRDKLDNRPIPWTKGDEADGTG